MADLIETLKKMYRLFSSYKIRYEEEKKKREALEAEIAEAIHGKTILNCFEGNQLICNEDIIHQLLISKNVAADWWKLTEEQRRVLGDYIIRKYASGYIKKYGEKRNEEIEWKRAVCMQHAMVRYCKLNFREPIYDLSKCYFLNSKNEVECFYKPPEECFWLPCYITNVVGSAFAHTISALQINKNFKNFDSWVFFQYSNSNIKPGNWQMPHGKEVSILRLRIENIKCWQINHDLLIKWRIIKAT